MRVLAVDFGTSTTVSAVSVDGGPARLLTIDGSALMPSAIFLTDAGTLAVGRDAERQSRLDPTRYEPNPKRRIDDGEVLLGVAALPVVEVIGEVLRHVGEEVLRQFGAPADEVRLTHPARWGVARRRVLVEAARQAGLVQPTAEPILIPEPVAAATHFAGRDDGAQVEDGSTLAVYDLGAGTFDVVVLRRAEGNWEVVNEAGLPDLGGLDFENSIVEHIGVTAGLEHPDEWTQLRQPPDAASRRLARAFAQDVKDSKEALSRFTQTDVAMPEPFQDLHLTRGEFEQLIRPQLERTVQLLGGQIERAGVTPDDLTGIYLVGGSSRIPLVAQLINERLGVTPSTLDQPETAVASGALATAVTATQTAATPAAPSPSATPQTGGGPAVAPPMNPGQPPGPSAPMQVGPPGGARQGQWPQTGGQPPQRPAAYNAPPPPAQPPPAQGYLPSRRPPAQQGAYGPRPPGGPPAQQQPPSAKRPKGLLIAVALALVAAIVVTVLVVLSNNDGDPGSEAGSSATASTDGPTATAAPTEATTPEEYDALLSEAQRDYLSDSYDLFVKCSVDKEFPDQPVCELSGGLRMIVVDLDADGYQAFSDDLGESGAVPGTYQESTWASADGKHGGPMRTMTLDQTGKPFVYWERDELVAVGLGPTGTAAGTITAEQLKAFWEENFNH